MRMIDAAMTDAELAQTIDAAKKKDAGPTNPEDSYREQHRAKAREIEAQLRAPYPAKDVKWKPQATSGNRALAVAYIDARDVADRLDEVMTVCGWYDCYEKAFDLPKAIICKLSLYLPLPDGTWGWVTKSDVGGESDQPDDGDKAKAAFSDALKRAAIKFGVGRYLYDLPKQWCDYDPTKKKFVTTPSLPAQFLPGAKPGKTENSRSPAPAPGVQSSPDAHAGKPANETSVLEKTLHRLAMCDTPEAVDKTAADLKGAGFEFGAFSPEAQGTLKRAFADARARVTTTQPA